MSALKGESLRLTAWWSISVLSVLSDNGGERWEQKQGGYERDKWKEWLRSAAHEEGTETKRFLSSKQFTFLASRDQSVNVCVSYCGKHVRGRFPPIDDGNW